VCVRSFCRTSKVQSNAECQVQSHAERQRCNPMKKLHRKTEFIPFKLTPTLPRLRSNTAATAVHCRDCGPTCSGANRAPPIVQYSSNDCWCSYGIGSLRATNVFCSLLVPQWSSNVSIIAFCFGTVCTTVMLRTPGVACSCSCTDLRRTSFIYKSTT